MICLVIDTFVDLSLVGEHFHNDFRSKVDNPDYYGLYCIIVFSILYSCLCPIQRTVLSPYQLYLDEEPEGNTC